MSLALCFCGLAAVGVMAVSAFKQDAGRVHQPPDGADLAGLLARIGERVEAYYARAQSILCLETVRLQPLAYDLSPEGRSRELVYDLRVGWEPAQAAGVVPEAQVLREIRTVDGRPPRPRDEPQCMDPKPVSLDPLAFLLAERQGHYMFSWAGTGREKGRSAVRLDYKSAGSPPADVKWNGDCVTIDLPARTRGRVWIDASSNEVLRLDERVIGPFDVRVPATHKHPFGTDTLTVDRADSSIRYKPVTFQDPDETVMLPESIQSVQVIRGSATPRVRITQTFSNYQRFVTDARIVR